MVSNIPNFYSASIWLTVLDNVCLASALETFFISRINLDFNWIVEFDSTNSRLASYGLNFPLLKLFLTICPSQKEVLAIPKIPTIRSKMCSEFSKYSLRATTLSMAFRTPIWTTLHRDSAYHIMIVEK